MNFPCTKCLYLAHHRNMYFFIMTPKYVLLRWALPCLLKKYVGTRLNESYGFSKMCNCKIPFFKSCFQNHKFVLLRIIFAQTDSVSILPTEAPDGALFLNAINQLSCLQYFSSVVVLCVDHCYISHFVWCCESGFTRLSDVYVVRDYRNWQSSRSSRCRLGILRALVSRSHF